MYAQVFAQMGLYTTGFVLLTLLINGPLLGPLLRALHINQLSAAKQQVRGACLMSTTGDHILPLFGACFCLPESCQSRRSVLVY
jgi:hypothetical protein